MINTLRDDVREPVAHVFEAFSVSQLTYEVSFLGRETERHHPAFTFAWTTTSRICHVTHCPSNFQHPQGRIEHLYGTSGRLVENVLVNNFCNCFR